MVFRGRLVGGFPPTPALILLSIKAPKEQEKKKAMYLHPTPTKEEDIPKGNKESNTNPTIANDYLAVYLSPHTSPSVLHLTCL